MQNKRGFYHLIDRNMRAMGYRVNGSQENVLARLHHLWIFAGLWPPFIRDSNFLLIGHLIWSFSEGKKHEDSIVCHSKFREANPWLTCCLGFNSCFWRIGITLPGNKHTPYYYVLYHIGPQILISNQFPSRLRTANITANSPSANWRLGLRESRDFAKVY